jgi:type I restriction enzyme S subunit
MTVIQPLWLREEDVPELPDGWIALTTNEACEQLKPGKLYSGKTTFESGDIPVLSQGESGLVGYHNDAPGVVASRNNPVVTFANHTCAMRLMTHPYSCIQNIFSKVGKDGVCDTRYFYYAAMGRVTIGDYKGHHPLFRQAYIPIPPMGVQHKIVSVLSTYDDLIENNTRRIEILEEMARRLYEEWFVHFRFPGHEEVSFKESELGGIPEYWEVGTLQDVIVLQRGFDLPVKKRTPGDFPIVSATGVSGTHVEAKIDGPGVVTGRSGSIGKVMYVHGSYWPLNTTLWGKAFPLGSSLFAFYTLSAIDLKGFNVGAAVPTLNRNDIHGLPVILPAKEVVQLFDQVAGPIHELVVTLEKKNANLRTQRDLLLPKLVSGEIDVSDIPMPDDKEVEAA